MSDIKGYCAAYHPPDHQQPDHYTTAPEFARSSLYCSDAKTVQAPIFHVNGDDPRRVRAARLAFEYRQVPQGR